jgi:hypothetical protein
VSLHRDLTNTELPGNLLIQKTGDHQHHNLPFSRRK